MIMEEKLNEYNRKRNFDKTLEPEGITEASAEGMAVPAEENTYNHGEMTQTLDPGGQGLRFVVQLHIASRKHYDFRLEWEDVLLSWASPKGPSYNTRDKRLAVKVEDHPLEYKDFEGVIPKGEYGGGVVMLWDEGFWEPQGNVEEGLAKGELKFILKGRRLKGKWALIRWKAKSGEAKENWLLLKEKDSYAGEEDGIAGFDTSIRTGRTIAEIEEGKGEQITRNPFDKAEVQLAKLVNRIPKEDGWLYELKYDGFRIIAYTEGNRVRLVTRNGNDYTKRFPEIVFRLMELASGRAMVLDGEMVITDAQGRTDFQALQNYLKNPGNKNLTYIVFDLLALDGEDLRERPLIDRKGLLEELMKDAPKNLYYGRYVMGKGEESLLAACEAGMEGIIGKKVNSGYSGTRNGDWIKLKCDNRQEFVIGGYTLSDKKTSGVSSLLLGFYENDALVYAGRAGTGMSEADMEELEERFKKLKRPDSPFLTPPPSGPKERLIWLEPELAAEIKFAEWTKDNRLRQASFKGLRTDKAPREIMREKEEAKIRLEPSLEGGRRMEEKTEGLAVAGVKITSPDKVIFQEPEITKADVIRYYEKVSERMLPYVSRRILSVVRCPRGIAQACFFQKHPAQGRGGNFDSPAADRGEKLSVPGGSGGIVTIPVITDGEAEEYIYIENMSGLIFQAQMGTLEFHIWGSRVDQLERPDMMVFDLDPDEGMDLGRVRQGARDMKELLAELSLDSYLKTSGGKGYHVVVPLKPAVTWEVFYDFAKRVAQVMEQKWPDRYTSNSRKNKRTGKIFVDWLRNGRGATSVAPYSLRAREGAGVSMPITWDELDTVAPDGIRMEDALMRMNGSDPWKGFFQKNQMLK